MPGGSNNCILMTCYSGVCDWLLIVGEIDSQSETTPMSVTSSVWNVSVFFFVRDELSTARNSPPVKVILSFKLIVRIRHLSDYQMKPFLT